MVSDPYDHPFSTFTQLQLATWERARAELISVERSRTERSAKFNHTHLYSLFFLSLSLSRTLGTFFLSLVLNGGKSRIVVTESTLNALWLILENAFSCPESR